MELDFCFMNFHMTNNSQERHHRHKMTDTHIPFQSNSFYAK